MIGELQMHFLPKRPGPAPENAGLGACPGYSIQGDANGPAALPPGQAGMAMSGPIPSFRL